MRSFIILISLFIFFLNLTYSEDWPMWRYDANRSAASPDPLPKELHLQWVRHFQPLKPAWPNEPRMIFDANYEPITKGKQIFIGSSITNTVTAYDIESGVEKWRYYADGPIRFAPVAWQDKIFFSSDDGYLYCLKILDGTLLWKFRGGPLERKIIGNERLISSWPARGGPVLKDGIIYFAAGIYPFMGIFIYALDAKTGKIKWKNSSTGSIYMTQGHGSPAFAGLAPQGYLAISAGRLLISNGRSGPAGLDLVTGKLIFYNAAIRGNSILKAIGNHFFNSSVMYEASKGAGIISSRSNFDSGLVLTKEVIYGGRILTAFDFKNLAKKETVKIKRGKETKV